MSDKVIHEYDDIKECDNKLPNWWLYILYGTVVFAIGYWFYYDVYGTGASPLAAYQREKAAAAAAEAERLKTAGDLTPEKLVEMSHNAAILAAGKTTFTQICAACHRADGGGQVGPNLTDEYWLGSPKPSPRSRKVIIQMSWALNVAPNRWNWRRGMSRNTAGCPPMSIHGSATYTPISTKNVSRRARAKRPWTSAGWMARRRPSGDSDPTGTSGVTSVGTTSPSLPGAPCRPGRGYS